MFNVLDFLAIDIDIDSSIPDNMSKEFVNDSQSFISTFLDPFLNFFIYMYGTVALLMLLLAGYYYIMASLNDKNYEKAKNIIKTVFILTIIFILSYTIIAIAANFF